MDTNLPHIPSKSYPLSLAKRYGLKPATPSRLDTKRLQVSCKEEIEPWLTFVYSTLQSLRPDPSVVLNIDETPLYYSPNNASVYIPAHFKTDAVQEIPEKHKTHTVTLAIALSGRAYPTQIIVPSVSAHIPSEYGKYQSSELLFDQTESGFQTKATFKTYMLQHIIPEIDKQRKKISPTQQNAVIFLDQHTSRMDSELLEYCRDQNIHIIPILAHASHLIQPLDRGVNSIFKRKFSAAFDRESGRFVHFLLLLLLSFLGILSSNSASVVVSQTLPQRLGNFEYVSWIA